MLLNHTIKVAQQLTAINKQNAHNPTLFHSRSVLRPLSPAEQMRRANALCASTPNANGLSCSRNIFIGMLMICMMIVLTSCSERMMGVGITGYNHSKVHPIFNFTVNGAMGSNLSQESGGGKESCCVMVPEKWRPGLKAKVAWVYDSDQGDPNPPPPPQEKEVEIPEYKNGGRLEVHFYDNHRVLVVVSRCGLGNPFYKMSDKDKLPWVDEWTKEETIESAKKRGDDYEC